MKYDTTITAMIVGHTSLWVLQSEISTKGDLIRFYYIASPRSPIPALEKLKDAGEVRPANDQQKMGRSFFNYIHILKKSTN